MSKMKMNKYVVIVVAGLFIFSCKDEVKTTPTAEGIDTTPYTLVYGDFPAPNIAVDNKLTIEGVKLGRMLFYEKMLSSDNTLSCAGCHNQNTAFSDTSRFSIGVKNLPGKRQAMGVFNLAWNTNEFFWDGRSHLLRDQSLMPIQDELEMNETLPNVVGKLQNSALYTAQFNKAFGTTTVTSELMSKAMEQFMNSIVSNQSKYDKFLAGKTTLTKEEGRGRFLFFTEYNPAFPNASGADCRHCHSGFNFENDQYMNNGLDADGNFADIGREAVTKRGSDKGRFKVPSLRNVALTFPYMHDGRFATLEEVVEHYNLVTNSATLDPSFKQQLPEGLKLTKEDKSALVAFLKTLTDEDLMTNKAYSNPF
jgi:cytochrome c peroxidase